MSKKPSPNDPVIRTLMLRRPIEERERNEKAETVCRLDAEVFELEEKKSKFNKEINAEIKALSDEAAPLVLEVHLGKEVPVECKVRLDWPDHGMKTITPQDTKADMEPVPMVAEDYQDELPLTEWAARECEVGGDESLCEPIDPKSKAIQNCKKCGRIMDDILDPDSDKVVKALPQEPAPA